MPRFCQTWKFLDDCVQGIRHNRNRGCHHQQKAMMAREGARHLLAATAAGACQHAPTSVRIVWRISPAHLFFICGSCRTYGDYLFPEVNWTPDTGMRFFSPPDLDAAGHCSCHSGASSSVYPGRLAAGFPRMSLLHVMTNLFWCLQRNYSCGVIPWIKPQKHK